MTNDLISQAEALLGRFAALKEHAKIKPNAVMLELIDIREALIAMVPGLVEEIKRLQADNEFLHKFVDDPGSTLEAALNAVREQSEVIRKQQAAFAATLTKWQQIAIDRTAQIGWHTSCNCGRLPNGLKWPYCDWAQEIPQSVRDNWNKWATKELGLQVGQEAGYLERLEKEFETLYLQTHWRKPDQSYEDQIREAQAALEKIREKR